MEKSSCHASKTLVFCLAATFNVLPSPSNLRRWHITTETSCVLCHKPLCTTSHVLSACNVALTQGRFTYRHDQVLACIVGYVKSFLSKLPLSSLPSFDMVVFVKEGEKKLPSKRFPSGLLLKANDWVVRADLSDNYSFSFFIAPTSLRPDIVIFCKKIEKSYHCRTYLPM